MSLLTEVMADIDAAPECDRLSIARQWLEYYLSVPKDETVQVCRDFGIQPAQAKMFIALDKARGNPVSRDHLMAVSARDGTTQKIVEVQICRIRRAIADHGYVINTVWGVGYSMTRVGE